MPTPSDQPTVQRHLILYAAAHGANAALLEDLMTFASDPILAGKPADLVVLYAIVRALYARWYAAEGRDPKHWHPVCQVKTGADGFPSVAWRIRENHFQQAITFVLKSFHGPGWYRWYRWIKHLLHGCTSGRCTAPPTARWYHRRSTELSNAWGKQSEG